LRGTWAMGPDLFRIPKPMGTTPRGLFRGGLELVASVGALKTHMPVQARVGIATGLVVVGAPNPPTPHRQDRKSLKLRQQPVGPWARSLPGVSFCGGCLSLANFQGKRACAGCAYSNCRRPRSYPQVSWASVSIALHHPRAMLVTDRSWTVRWT
jgi:hypothetical protein